MQTEYYFPTQIYITDLYLDNESLAKKITDWRDRDEGIQRSNKLGWHSAIDMHHREEYNEFTMALFDAMKEVMNNECYHPNLEPLIGTMWANINKKFSYNKTHVHPGSLWSGVYYVKAPENYGDLLIKYPRSGPLILDPRRDENKQRPRQLWNEVKYKPTVGRLIIFPGWLPHEVDANQSEDERISISFNTNTNWKKDEYVKVQRKGHETGGNITESTFKNRYK